MSDDRTQDGTLVMSRRAKLLAAGVVAAAIVAVAASCFRQKPEDKTDDKSSHSGAGKQRLFVDWPKPDLVLILSGQQHGYLLPCGCSRPQVGGLERRYNFVQSLRDRGWPVAAVDVGDIAQRHGPAKMPNTQGLLKYKYSMEALKRIGYSAVALGENEVALGLDNALATFVLQNFDPVTNKPLPPFVLAANLADRERNFPEMLNSWKVITPPGTDIKLGIIGVVSPKMAEQIKQLNDDKVKFPDGSDVKAIDAALKEMATEKPDLHVLLYQGHPDEARARAKAYPNIFQVILCATTFDEPPSEPEIIKEAGTFLVTIGHKGKYIGAVGINRTSKDAPKFQLRYQLVRMSEDLETPKGKEKGHPILELMEAYTTELKGNRETGEYLAKVQKSKLGLQVDKSPDKKPAYVGSERCKKCHEHESQYEIWEKSAHAHAYKSLVEATRPSKRQFDGECIVCHTVGFEYESGFRNAKDTPNLLNVGCESCHGPSSQHVKNPQNMEERAALNPWKGDAKRIEIDLCIKCHDSDNDVHWSFDKWKKIVHPNPKE